MTAKEKAKELVKQFEVMHFQQNKSHWSIMMTKKKVKQSALICVEKEYHSLREYLFNLKSSLVIENHTVYLVRLETLIEEEKEIKQEINKL